MDTQDIRENQSVYVHNHGDIGGEVQGPASVQNSGGAVPSWLVAIIAALTALVIVEGIAIIYVLMQCARFDSQLFDVIMHQRTT